MKGIIICGYPGVGKSSIAGWNNCIDLESSLFSHQPRAINHKNPIDDTTYTTIPIRINNWVPQYCKVAIDLAYQGYTVLTSTHRAVIEYFLFEKYYPENVAGVVIFCPDHRYKKEWIERLTERYAKTMNSKDERALNRVIDHFDDDIHFLNNCGLPVYIPAAMDYDLKDYITMIQNTRCLE